MRAGTIRLRGLGDTREIALNSSGYKKASTTLPGAISSMSLKRQVSKTQCVDGSTFGSSGNSAWVDKGCRGVFNVTYAAASSPAPAPSGSGIFFNPGSPSGGYFGSPVPDTPSMPATPPPPTTTTPTCTTNWTAETALVNQAVNQIRACQGGALPAEVPACPAGTSGDGSYQGYLNARSAGFAATDDAATACAGTGLNNGYGQSPYGNPQSQYGYQPYGASPYAPAATVPADEPVPTIQPTPASHLSRGTKAGIGIGGLVLVLGLGFMIMRGNKRSRRA